MIYFFESYSSLLFPAYRCGIVSEGSGGVMHRYGGIPEASVGAAYRYGSIPEGLAGAMQGCVVTYN